jgi:hypothetical protein
LSIKQVAQEFTASALAGLANNEEHAASPLPEPSKRQTPVSARVRVDRPGPGA